MATQDTNEIVADDLTVEGQVVVEDQTDAEEDLVFEENPDAPQTELLAGIDPELAEDEISARLEEIKEEYGELTELLVDTVFDDDVADLVLELAPRLDEVKEEVGPKVRFFMHHERNGDHYVLRSLKGNEFQTAWIQLLSGQDKALDLYSDDMLQEIMVYPRFEETDWDWTGEGMNAPGPFLKNRLIGTYFSQEMPDPSVPNSLAFTQKDFETATKAAKKKRKPSL